MPPPRPARPRGPFAQRLERVGQVAAYVGCVVLAAFFVFVIVATAHDRGEP
ncbi:hypothetical protein ACPEEZ_01355 [Frigoribacterium sp. 2-23]|uniref:hypothetical protein n=1 Tax=Frigoribacterium sp. 2-23 TaxID=3415006 RepID=UPI003C6F42E4